MNFKALWDGTEFISCLMWCFFYLFSTVNTHTKHEKENKRNFLLLEN